MSSSSRRVVLAGVALPVALVGTMLSVPAAHASSTTVSSKAALNAAFGAAANGDVITLGQDLLGDGGVNDAVVIPGAVSVTLNLNGRELDVDRVEVGDSSRLVVSGGRLVVGGDSVSVADSGVTGLVVASDGLLQVQGGTTLIATGSTDRAGIGTIAGDDSNAVFYVDPGATVVATGGSHGAGIGGGAGAVPLRTISIGDATVTATGGVGAAGIGGGYANPAGSNLIRIDNTPTGTVTATGGAGAAGIGGGQASGAGTGKGSVVTLNDADVTVADGGVASGGGTAPSAIGGGQGAAATDWGTINRTFSGAAGRRDTLRVAAGATLSIPSGKTVANPGTLVVRGTLTGAGTITNSGIITQEGAGVIVDAALSVTGRNHTVTFDAAGGTTTAPATRHVYATTFATAGLDLGSYTGSNAGRALTGWSANGTAVTNTTDLATLATAGTVALTAVYAAAAPSGGTGTTSPTGAAAAAGTTGATGAGVTIGTGGATGTGGTAGAGSTTTPGAAPTLPVLRTTTVRLGHPLSVHLGAGSTTAVTYAARGLPSGIAIDAGTGQLYGAPRTSGRSTVTVSATNAAGTTSTTFTIVVPAATHVITGSAGAVTPTAGKPVAVTIRGLEVGERWTIAVDGKPVRTGVTRFGGTVRSSVRMPKKAKDAKHVIRVSSDRRLTDPAETAVHEVTVTAVTAKKALRLTRKGRTLTVRGLAAKERVAIRRGHTVIASGRADAKGVFVVTKKTLKQGALTVTGATKHRTDTLRVQ